MSHERRLGAAVPTLLLAAVAVFGGARGAAAQSLGTFRWQLQPFCNVLTTEVIARDGRYQVIGTDDQCGAARFASVIGLAFPNPDGSIGLGLTTVTTPGGVPVHIDATIAAATGSGSWRDSAGNAGAFVLTPGAGTGGGPRPVPPGGIAPGSITGADIAPGSITAGALSATSIATAATAGATCAPDQAIAGFDAAGRAVCRGLRPVISTTLPYSEAFDVGVAMGGDGLPVVAHVDNGAGGMRVTHCGNLSCTAGTTSTVVWPMLDGALGTQLLVGSDGATTVVGPVRTQAGQYPTILRVARCASPSCVSGTTITDLPIGQLEGRLLAELGSNHRLVLGRAETVAGRWAVRLIFCGDVACASGNVTTDVAVDPNTNPSFIYEIVRLRVDGSGGIVVVFAQRTFTNSTWTYFQTRCTTAGCAAASARSPIRARLLVRGSDGLPVGAWVPALGETYPDDGVLRVLHCDDDDCLSSTVVIADAPATHYVGQEAALAIGADGLPVVSHWDFTVQALRVTHCGTVDCTAGNVSAVVDDPPQSVGGQSRVVIASDGLPLIVHRDAAAQALRITKCTTRDCR